ncbi:MAG: PqqD family protein, partial [Pseudomonadota bacterium]|nr:PqqD family protein [Pseudomonadota bacterium]
VRAIQVEGEAMLHDPTAQKVYVLNPTAALIWSLCDGNHTVEQMVDAIHTQFSQTTQADILQDVQQTLAWLNEYDLLE